MPEARGEGSQESRSQAPPPLQVTPTSRQAGSNSSAPSIITRQAGLDDNVFCGMPVKSMVPGDQYRRPLTTIDRCSGHDGLLHWTSSRKAAKLLKPKPRCRVLCYEGMVTHRRAEHLVKPLTASNDTARCESSRSKVQIGHGFIPKPPIGQHTHPAADPAVWKVPRTRCDWRVARDTSAVEHRRQPDAVSTTMRRRQIMSRYTSANREQLRQ